MFSIKNSTMLEENKIDKECRICMVGDGDLISPCLCKGDGNKFVHRECLDTWRSQNQDAFDHCSTCLYQYTIEHVIDDPIKEKERISTYRLYMLRDTLFFIISVFLIISIPAIFIGSTDLGKNVLELYPSYKDGWWEYLIYYFLGLLFCLFIVGIFGMMSFQDNCNGCCRNIRCPSSGSGLGAFLLIIVILFIIIGIPISIYYSIVILRSRAKQHIDQLWNYQQAKKYRVKDLNC